MDLRSPIENSELFDPSSISFDKISSTDFFLCEECDKDPAPAKYRCTECEQNLCVGCEKRLHNKGARKNHHRTAITMQTTTPQESKAPDLIKTKQSSLTFPLTDNSPSPYYPNQPLKLHSQCNP